jgi:hypothetical protein
MTARLRQGGRKGGREEGRKEWIPPAQRSYRSHARPIVVASAHRQLYILLPAYLRISTRLSELYLFITLVAFHLYRLANVCYSLTFLLLATPHNRCSLPCDTLTRRNRLAAFIGTSRLIFTFSYARLLSGRFIRLLLRFMFRSSRALLSSLFKVSRKINVLCKTFEITRL